MHKLFLLGTFITCFIILMLGIFPQYLQSLNTHVGIGLFGAAVLFIGFINKYLGIFLVIIVTSMMAYKSLQEGFDVDASQIQTTLLADQATAQANKATQQATMQANIATIKANAQAKQASAATTATTTTEGFDIIGMENNMKRGKQASSIPVFENRGTDIDVSPYQTFRDYSLI